MRYEFKLPDVGEGISEAELVEWKVGPGDAVTEDTEIGIFSTDKVTVELPSPCGGKIVSLHGDIGEVIQVGTVLAIIERTDGGTATTNFGEETGAAQAAAPAAAASSAASAEASTPSGSLVPAGDPSAPIVAAPSTRKLARELGVELAGMKGSGPGGRILRDDVQAAKAGAGVAKAPARAPAAPREVFESEGDRRVPLAGARAVSARNLHDSVSTTVTTTTTFEVPGDGMKALLRQLKPQAEKCGLKLSPVHLMAKCAAAALKAHERFNATVDEATGDLILHGSVDLGIAVAAGDKLVVPVIRGVHGRLLFDVVADVAEVAERARVGGLRISDLRGGTFTLSSTGGLERTTILSTRPIISPPQTAILWVSRIIDRPRVIDGELSAGPMMTCSLSFDHRYIDGAEATIFINDLANYLEHPEQALA